MNLLATLVLVGAAVLAQAGTTAPSEVSSTSVGRQIQVGAGPLSQFMDRHPTKLAILLVSTPGCGFCERLRRQQLAPLLGDPAYSELAVFEVQMRDQQQFTPAIDGFSSFDGRQIKTITSPADLASALGIRVAPTVLLLGGHRELSERLVGYGSPDFYWAYLSERIESAVQALEQGSASEK